jgi:hypothetical protein
MPKALVFAALVAAALGSASCALVTRFDPAVSADASGDGGNSGCPASALLCEDFENGFGPPWTDTVNSSGTVTIDGRPDPVHSGQHALHAQSDAIAAGMTGQTLAVWEKTASTMQPMWPPTIYVRVWVYWGSNLAKTVANFMEVETVDMSTAGYVIYSGMGGFGWSYFGPSCTNCAGTIPYGDPSFPKPGWTCVVWEVGPSIQVGLNGPNDPNLAGQGEPTFPYGDFRIGIILDQATTEPSVDLWLDDLVVDQNPLQCTN